MSQSVMSLTTQGKLAAAVREGGDAAARMSGNSNPNVPPHLASLRWVWRLYLKYYFDWAASFFSRADTCVFKSQLTPLPLSGHP